MTDLHKLAADYRAATDGAILDADRMATTFAEGIGEVGEPSALASLRWALENTPRDHLEHIALGALLAAARAKTGTILKARIEARRG